MARFTEWCAELEAALAEPFPRDERIVQRAKDGELYAVIGADYGITPERVGQICRKAGFSCVSQRKRTIRNPLSYAKRQTDAGALVYEHVLIVERVLGKTLPLGAEVHHANGRRRDNRNENLVICQDRAYHMLIHVRMRAKAACGNPNWRKCRFCKAWDAVERLSQERGAERYYHKSCATERMRKRGRNG